MNEKKIITALITFTALLVGNIMASTAVVPPLSDLTVGFLGCGKISSAMCRGFCSLEGGPKQILISRRSEAKSAVLVDEFPHMVQIAENDRLVMESDVIFIGLLPAIARSILPELTFSKDKFVISMMAAVNFDEVLKLTKLDSKNVVRTVPLPSAARRSGPILMHPRNNFAETVLAWVGTPVACDDEAEMKPMVALTGHISPFYELLRVTQQFLVSSGVTEESSKSYVAAFYSSLAQGAEVSPESFAALCEEAATPGGLNEQALGFMRSSDHYNTANEVRSHLTHMNSSLDSMDLRPPNCPLLFFNDITVSAANPRSIEAIKGDFANQSFKYHIDGQ